MKILIIGEQRHVDECRQKLGEHEYSEVTDHSNIDSLKAKNDLVFDFIIDKNPNAFQQYAGTPAKVFLNTSLISLAELAHRAGKKPECPFFGFNGLPTLFNRDLLEVSLWQKEDEALLKETCEQLGTDYVLVDDRVGMVTPRVICMIINEAYYTVQEGTATREDIDIAMKLGTNYPYGPFEWCERIGLKHIYELLEAIYNDTRDERYKICPLLKKEYLRQLTISN